MTRFVAIVDPYSSGALLTAEFKRRGFACVAVLTGFPIQAVFAQSYVPENYSKQLIFSNNAKQIASELNELNVEAVVAGAETGIKLADELCELLQLPGNPAASSHCRRNKYDMIEATRNAGLKSYKQLLTDSHRAVESWLMEHNRYPVVVKPVDSAGSDGVFICKSHAETISAINAVLGQTNKFEQVNAKVLIQEYVGGTEYVVDSVSLDGEHVVSNVFRYNKEPANGSDVVYRAIEPIELSDPTALVLIEYNNKVLDALGVVHGATHSEIMLTAEGPVLIEVGARLHGGNIPAVVQKCAPWSQIELTVDACIDPDSFRLRAKKPLRYHKNILIHFAISNTQGELKAYIGEQRIRQLDSFFDLMWFVGLGQRVNKTVDLYTCPLKVILAHEDRAQIEKDRKQLLLMERQEAFFAL